jgi:hypothetical protein
LRNCSGRVHHKFFLRICYAHFGQGWRIII